jgi:hypothetical protein
MASGQVLETMLNSPRSLVVNSSPPDAQLRFPPSGIANLEFVPLASFILQTGQELVKQSRLW